jgi:hypothetical protein
VPQALTNFGIGPLLARRSTSTGKAIGNVDNAALQRQGIELSIWIRYRQESTF